MLNSCSAVLVDCPRVSMNEYDRLQVDPYIFSPCASSSFWYIIAKVSTDSFVRVPWDLAVNLQKLIAEMLIFFFAVQQ